jgi:hypothetical protein
MQDLKTHIQPIVPSRISFEFRKLKINRLCSEAKERKEEEKVKDS